MKQAPAQAPETLRFQAEVQELLGLMIHSLYKKKEIFLRELVSNASDALDKLRFEALTRPELDATPDSLRIQIELDPAARTLSVEDSGIGMSRAELVENLGTIARSGTRAFLDRARTANTSNASAPELIGQFGVGFYSSFIVADRVVVESLRAGESEAWRWSSDGQGAYTLEPGERTRRGTRVTLHLRPAAEGEDEVQDFTDAHVVREVVQRYSDFVGFPIEMEIERFVPKEGGKPGEGGMVKELTVLNSMRPLWTRPKDEITPEEHAEFYRQLSHDWEAPLETLHVKAEGTLEYTALLYLPAKRPMDLFAQNEARSKVALYVRRVLIVPECEDLLPAWLRWVRGVVDASDLPLNVSREVLQQNAQVRQIKKHLTKRVLESLAAMLEKERAKYAGLWSQFGVLLKEGLVLGEDDGGRLAKLALFSSTHGDEPVTLSEYVSRMKPDQAAIWYATGEDRARVSASPHVAAFRQRGEEVLLLTDPVDEWLVDRLREFEGKPLRAVDRDDAETESSAQKEAREALEREHRDVLSALEKELGAHVSAVRISTRLGDAPAALQTSAHGLSPHMARILRAAQRDVPEEKRVLVLNPDHALFAKLARIRKEKGEAHAEFGELASLVHGQALLAEGSPLPDPARFVQLLARWLTRSD